MGQRTSATFAGIVNIDKPAGMTSHDVVNRVRRMSGQRRVGHAGTLDPLATGVLIICAGWATRRSEYLMNGQKRYRAVVRLGVTTDTYDAEGTVTSEADSCRATRSQVTGALDEFRGEIEQVPPMYSAVKHQGKPLHKLARQGKTVTRKARSVHIYELHLTGWNPPDAVLDVVCSKGTYIRSLAHDLGQRIGCGAYLAELTRLSSGPFDLAEAVTLEELETAFSEGREKDLLYPVPKALADFEMWRVDDATGQRIQHGQPVGGAPGGRSLAMAWSPSGQPLAVLRYVPDSGQWQPIKVFA